MSTKTGHCGQKEKNLINYLETSLPDSKKASDLFKPEHVLTQRFMQYARVERGSSEDSSGDVPRLFTRAIGMDLSVEYSVESHRINPSTKLRIIFTKAYADMDSLRELIWASEVLDDVGYTRVIVSCPKKPLPQYLAPLFANASNPSLAVCDAAVFRNVIRDLKAAMAATESLAKAYAQTTAHIATIYGKDLAAARSFLYTVGFAPTS